MLLLSTMVPLRKLPAGNQTTPPPPAEQASIAFWIAPVSSRTPSPFAPCAVTSHTEAGRSEASVHTAVARINKTHFIVESLLGQPLPAWVRHTRSLHIAFGKRQECR